MSFDINIELYLFAMVQCFFQRLNPFLNRPSFVEYQRNACIIYIVLYAILFFVRQLHGNKKNVKQLKEIRSLFHIIRICSYSKYKTIYIYIYTLLYELVRTRSIKLMKSTLISN